MTASFKAVLGGSWSFLRPFFSREHVVITSIELTAVIERGYTYPSPRRAISQRHSGASSESMFTADAFRGSDFAQLLEHFEQSTPHDVLARAMRLIVSSYQINNLESAYFLAHSAVEAICKELTRDFQGKKIEDLLNDDFEAVKDIFSRMSEKLDSKKKGRVVMDFLRVIITLDRLDIDLSCMNGWRKDGWEHGWERGIKHAFINRNDLFHQGLVKNPDLLTQDLYRLRFIFELIALKLLDIDLNSSGYHPIGGW